MRQLFAAVLLMLFATAAVGRGNSYKNLTYYDGNLRMAWSSAGTLSAYSTTGSPNQFMDYPDWHYHRWHHRRSKCGQLHRYQPRFPTNLWVGNPVNPPGGNLSFGFAGSIIAIYGLFSGDLLALDTIYGSLGAVISKIRQNHSDGGALCIETKGSNDEVPTAGSQESKIWTDNKGLHFRNSHSGGLATMGSIGKFFDFDSPVHVQSDIVSSGTVKMVSLWRTTGERIPVRVIQTEFGTVLHTDGLVMLDTFGAGAVSVNVTLPDAASCPGTVIMVYGNDPGGAFGCSVGSYDGIQVLMGQGDQTTTLIPMLQTLAHFISTGT